MVHMMIDTQGIPRDLTIVRSRGAALDQSALNAVSQYRFKPSLDATGVPVAMPINVEV
jgi:protein TonB